MLAMELDHVGSCCHDSNASGPRVLSHDVFHNARVDFAIAIVKKGSPRILAMEPVVQEEIESLLIDATVHDLFIWDLWGPDYENSFPIDPCPVLLDKSFIGVVLWRRENGLL